MPIQTKKAFKKAAKDHAAWLTRTTGWSFTVKFIEDAGFDELDDIDSLGALAVLRGESPDGTKAVSVEMDLGFMDLDEGYVHSGWYNPYESERHKAEHWDDPAGLQAYLRSPRKLWGWLVKELKRGLRARNNDGKLRKDLIRLAFQREDLRPVLLPLLKEAAAKDAPSMKLGEAFVASSLATAKAVAKTLKQEADFAEIKVEKPYTPARFSAASIVSFKVTYTDDREDALGWISCAHGWDGNSVRPKLSCSFFFGGTKRFDGTLLNVETGWDDGSAKVSKYAKHIVDEFFRSLL